MRCRARVKAGKSRQIVANETAHFARARAVLRLARHRLLIWPNGAKSHRDPPADFTDGSAGRRPQANDSGHAVSVDLAENRYKTPSTRSPGRGGHCLSRAEIEPLRLEMPRIEATLTDQRADFDP